MVDDEIAVELGPVRQHGTGPNIRAGSDKTGPLARRNDGVRNGAGTSTQKTHKGQVLLCRVHLTDIKLRKRDNAIPVHHFRRHRTSYRRARPAGTEIRLAQKPDWHRNSPDPIPLAGTSSPAPRWTASPASPRRMPWSGRLTNGFAIGSGHLSAKSTDFVSTQRRRGFLNCGAVCPSATSCAGRLAGQGLRCILASLHPWLHSLPKGGDAGLVRTAAPGGRGAAE